VISHYFKVASRNLARNKIFSLINISGLAVGMGVFLLISQFIFFESSYDRFHSNAENIYRLTLTSKRGADLNSSAYSGYALGPSGKEMIPEIEQFVRIQSQMERMVVSNRQDNVQYQENKSWYVDSNFLQLFDFPLSYGDPKTALRNKNDIVITEQVAQKYFGESNCLGKELQVNEGSLNGDFIVTGVLKQLPNTSHLQFDILLPMAFLLENETTYSETNGWEWVNFVTYVSIDKNADPEIVAEKFDQVFDFYIGDDLAEEKVILEAGLQPLVDIHLKSEFTGDIAVNNGDSQNITFFSIIAILILFMAWANYINLSTVQALGRAKEIGVKKIIGADRKQLIGQFLIESFLVNFLAAVFSIGIAYLLLPILNKILGQKLSLDVITNLKFLAGFALVIVVGTLLSGLYSAFILSGYKPLNILKSNTIKQRSGLSLRKGLIIFQFFISMLLISGTYLIYRQVLFMKNQDLGLDIEKILVLDGPSRILEKDISARQSKFQVFKEEVIKYPSISEVSGSSSIPGRGSSATLDMWALDAADEMGLNQRGSIIFIDDDFFDTYDFELVSGEDFRGRGKWIPNDVIINEAAVRAFGLQDPENAIGKRLAADYGGVDTITISAVVRDFHWSSLKDSYSPYVFVHNQSYNSYYSLKIDVSNIQSTIDHIQAAYKSAFPEDPFNYYFLDEDFNRQYQADIQFANLFSVFSVLAIFIACLGLFALVSVSAFLRAKEISIRKVLGASVGKLMFLLVREYIFLLGVSAFLAVPAVIWGGKAWLENYPYQVAIGLGVLLVPGIILFAIAFFTVSYQTYRRANTNPVKSLE
jgi:putative ABC transport system permease protein